MLVYFNELAKRFKPPSLWSKWSMLKTTLQLRNNIDIGNYHKLKNFLKQCSKRYQSKKSKVFTWKEIQEFLKRGDDYFDLAMKVFKFNHNIVFFCNVMTLSLDRQH